MLVPMDLFVAGQFELALWGSATVRHVTAAGKDNILATPPLIVANRVETRPDSSSNRKTPA
jgi:hypothetical protein